MGADDRRPSPAQLGWRWGWRPRDALGVEGASAAVDGRERPGADGPSAADLAALCGGPAQPPTSPASPESESAESSAAPPARLRPRVPGSSPFLVSRRPHHPVSEGQSMACGPEWGCRSVLNRKRLPVLGEGVPRVPASPSLYARTRVSGTDPRYNCSLFSSA